MLIQYCVQVTDAATAAATAASFALSGSCYFFSFYAVDSRKTTTRRRIKTEQVQMRGFISSCCRPFGVDTTEILRHEPGS